MKQPRRVEKPGEVMLRVTNIQRMKYFYRRALGFELIGEFPNAALLEIAGPDGNRIQAIGLLKQAVKSAKKAGTDQRISFSISMKDCRAAQRKLERLGFRVEAGDPNRIWVQDPEGNRVELICPVSRSVR